MMKRKNLLRRMLDHPLDDVVDFTVGDAIKILVCGGLVFIALLAFALISGMTPIT